MAGNRTHYLLFLITTTPHRSDDLTVSKKMTMTKKMSFWNFFNELQAAIPNSTSEEFSSTKTHICTYIHMYMHTYIHTNVPTNICTYIHMYIHTYVHIYVQTYAQLPQMLLRSHRACCFVHVKVHVLTYVVVINVVNRRMSNMLHFLYKWIGFTDTFPRIFRLRKV
jgi:hypothetical protein